MAVSVGMAREAWIVDYVDQAGDRHIETFDRKKEADDYQATVKVEERKGTHTAPSKSPTVAEAAEKWIRNVEAKGRERTTVTQYQQHVDTHIVPRLGRYKIASLTTGAIENFRDEMLAAGMSLPLARKVLTSLKSLLKTSKHAHVAADVSIERDKRRRKLEAGRDFPTPAEIKRLITAATAQSGDNSTKRLALLLTAALTGLRASELRALRWQDVDLKGEELHVRQRADRYNAIGSPKSESSQRTVPLDRHMLLPAVMEWKAKSAHKNGLVFPTSTGAIEHHANMLRSLEPIMTAARLVDKDGKPKYALHAFRHFFASWCLNPVERGGLGMQPQDVQRLLGHSSIVMTMDVYGHLFPGGDHHSKIAAASRALFA